MSFLDEIRRLRPATPPAEEWRNTAPTRSLARALHAGGGLIAEFKRAAPGRDLGPVGAPRELAALYQENGAAAVSVVVEEHFFRTTPADLQAVRAAVTLPLLAKGFFFTPAELVPLRNRGADAVLLIAALFARADLVDMLRAAARLGLEALVEVHDEQELTKVQGLPIPLLGVNNRHLHTLRVEPERGAELVRRAAAGNTAATIVIESGLRDHEEIRRFRALGAHGFLIGTALLTSKDPAALLRRLAGESSP